MTYLGKWECGVVIFLVLVLLASIIPALQYARQEKRDGIRRAELRAFKTELEMYFNDHDKYPLAFDASPHEYVVVEDDDEGVIAFYIRAELENTSDARAGFNEEFNVYYRVVNEGDKAFYDICGGELRCGVDSDF